MLFTSHAIKLLTEDHEKIRAETKIMRNLDIPQTERKQAFARLLPHLNTHNKKEEKAVYSFMKLCDGDDLRIWALEGKEEHILVDQLIKKMLSVDISGEEWSAKGKVLAELIDHHIEEEEKEIFPAMNRELNEDSDQQLVHQYENQVSEAGFARPITKDKTITQPYR
jgi:hemerythrin-like domain-containing protein